MRPLCFAASSFFARFLPSGSLQRCSLLLLLLPHTLFLQEIMKEWTKEVLRAQPADIYAWSAKYFAEKAAAAGGGGGK